MTVSGYRKWQDLLNEKQYVDWQLHVCFLVQSFSSSSDSYNLLPLVPL